MTIKFDIEKFSRKNDFGLWRIKMEFGHEFRIHLLICV